MMEHDAIHMRGLEFYARHGVLPEERVLGQRFQIDVDLFLDLGRAGSSDRLEDSLDYGAVYQAVADCVLDEQYRLLEKLAEEIANKILQQFICHSVRVEVHKPQAPIPGIIQDVSVEIWR